MLFAVSLSATSLFAESYEPDPSKTGYYISNGDYLSLRISPDAAHLAALVRSDATYGLIFLDAKDFSVVGGMKVADGEIIDEFRWVNEDCVVFSVAEHRSGWELPSGTGEMWAVNKDGSDVKLLAGMRAQDENRGSRIRGRERSYATFELVHSLPDDPKHILVAEYPWERSGSWLRDTRSTFPIVSKLNIRSAKLTKVTTLPHRGASAFADSDGQLRYLYWESEGARLKSSYRAGDRDDWREILEFSDASAAPRVYGIDSEAGLVYLGVTSGEEGYESIIRLNPETGEQTTLLDSLQSDVTHLFYDPISSLPVGVASIPGGPRYDYLDPDHPIARFHRGLAKAFEGQLVDITNADRSGNVFVIHVESDTNPGEFYLYDRRSKEARFVFANRSWMDVSRLASKIPMQITARDGVVVPVLLTLPTTGKDRQAPLIVYAHGGPHGVRSAWQFEEEVQLLAARGFAVLQVNHRGSGGYGEAYLEMGYRQWGGAMIDDIEDAVAAVLQAHGDQLGQVCSYGASFGGYASLALATRNPEWLSCSAGFAGVYDLTVQYSKGDIPTLPFGKDYLELAIGTDKSELEEFSPLSHAEKVSVPVLLIHGGQDRRVPAYHARAMRNALRAAEKDVELIMDGTVGHGIYGEERRIAHWERLIAFFEESIGAGHQQSGHGGGVSTGGARPASVPD